MTSIPPDAALMWRTSEDAPGRRHSGWKCAPRPRKHPRPPPPPPGPVDPPLGYPVEEMGPDYGCGW